MNVIGRGGGKHILAGWNNIIVEPHERNCSSFVYLSAFLVIFLFRSCYAASRRSSWARNNKKKLGRHFDIQIIFYLQSKGVLLLRIKSMSFHTVPTYRLDLDCVW